MNGIIELLNTHNNEIFKLKKLSVDINNDLNTLRDKYDKQILINKKLEKSYEELENDMKQMKNEIIQLKDNNEKTFDQIITKNKQIITQNEQIITENKELKNSNQMMKDKMANMEKQINEYLFSSQINKNESLKKDLDTYSLNNELEECRKQNWEYKNIYLSIDNEIEKIIQKKLDEKLTKYILNDNTLSFIKNRDNFSSIAYILLIANGEDIDNFEDNKFEYLRKIKLDNNLREFFEILENDSYDWNIEAHSGFKNKIVYNLFKLLGKEDSYDKNYETYLTDDLILKCKEFIKTRAKFKLNLVTMDNFMNDYNNLKNLIQAKRVSELFAKK